MSALVHGLRILRCFTEDAPRLTLTEISRRTGLSKSYAHRLVGILVEEQMLVRLVTGEYALSVSLFELGTLAAGNAEKTAGPVMARLVRQTGETVQYGVPDRTDIIFVYRSDSPFTFETFTRTGGRTAAHCSAGGKVILAHRPDLLEAVLRGGLRPSTPNTITSPEELLRHLEEVRAKGYAIADEELELGVRAVAAPVRDHTGEVVACLSLSGPVTRVPTSRLHHELAPLVIEAAEEISRRLGANRAVDGPRPDRM